MTLVQTIKAITDWLNDNVCQKITLKLPDDYKNDNDYDVAMVHPTAFPLYVPGKDRLPPGVPAPIPSICVQLMDGSDDLSEKRRTLQIRLCLACWNPGKHGDEIYQPVEDSGTFAGYSYYKNTEGAEQDFTRNMDGWKDSFNFADMVLREIENTEFINGLRLVKEKPIKYGLFTEDGTIWDYYPYWHNWITIELESGITDRRPDVYEKFL